MTKVYSKKYGRWFNSRSELGQYDWRQRRATPIFSWFGIRDAGLDPEWVKEHRPTGGLSGKEWCWCIGAAVIILALYSNFFG